MEDFINDKEVFKVKNTLEINNQINTLRAFMKKNLLPHQMHSTLLIEDLQKTLVSTQKVDMKILKTLTTVYGALSEKQQYINEEFLKLKEELNKFQETYN